jgi:site-specific recombinase XerD
MTENLTLNLEKLEICGEKKLRGIYERDPGSKIWWIRYADLTGRIRREKAGTKGTALKLYQKRKMEVLQGKKLPENLRAPLVSFEELAKDALAYSKAHKRSYGDDEIRMEKLLASFRGHTADSITPQDMERSLSKNAEENGWAPATANRYRALISLVYRLGILNGKVKENPAKFVKHRLENNARVRWLSGEEEVRLRTYLAETYPEHLPELDLALNTGMRLGEMYSLAWENVNTSRKVLTIPRSKNGEIRHIPLNCAALSALTQLRKRSKTPGAGPVVCDLKGRALASPRFWFEPAIPKAKIRNFTWHCLRHTFASRLVMAGVDLRTVQELMGHKSIQMTVRYAHLTPKHTLAAVELLGANSKNGSTGTRTSTGGVQGDGEEVSHAF